MDSTREVFTESSSPKTDLTRIFNPKKREVAVFLWEMERTVFIDIERNIRLYLTVQSLSEKNMNLQYF